MLKTQSWCLPVWMLAVVALTSGLIAAPDRAAAAPVPSQAASTTAAQPDAGALAAERALLQARLVGFGLTERAAADRVALLTDEEVHALVAHPDSLQAAGAVDAGDAIWVLLAVVLLIRFWPYMNADAW